MNSIKQSYGTLNCADGGQYQGEFRDGKANGHGTFILPRTFPEYNYTLPDGRLKYVGEFQDGKANGQGILSIIDEKHEDIYMGEWTNGKANGQGAYIPGYGLKDTYVGEFRDGEANGHGTYTYKNNDATYVGEFRNGEFEGQGTYKSSWMDGEYIYIGEFKGSVMHGQGTVIFNNGDKYKGEFSSDDYVKGTYTFTNGDKYVGEFASNNQPHGKGTYIFTSGKKLVGEFRYSELVESSVEDVFFPFSKAKDPLKIIEKYGTGFKIISRAAGTIKNTKIDTDVIVELKK